MDAIALMLKSLNTAQRAAVTSESSVVQVLAPPGSGKTKTLTARVAYLISNMGKDPDKIIVCTFTVKAAREMKDRLTFMLGASIANKLILGTFHSICLRILSQYGKHISLDKKFGIADSSDSNAIIARIIKRLGLSVEAKKARGRISSLKSQGKSAVDYAEQCARSSAKRNTSGDAVATQEFVTVFLHYEEHLAVSNLLDYDDLLLKCGKLMREFPHCVQHIQAVLIDEFQDTNHVQFDLMRLFSSAQKVVTTVGDPDQSIYGWRSADITNLRKMKETFPDLHTVNLEENYRSSGAILLAAQEVIEQDKSRPAKSLLPTHAIGLSPVMRTLPTAGKEADWLVSEILRTKALTAGLLKWSDYAILLRSASLSRLIEAAFGKAGIPYRMVGGSRFFDRYEVKLVLDYLRVIDMTGHTDAVSRIINVPARQIGDVTMKYLLDEAARRRVPLWDLIKSIVQRSITLPSKDIINESGMSRSTEAISKQARKGLESFFDIVHRARAKLNDSSEESLSQYIEWLVKRIGLRNHLKDKYSEDFEARWANVTELVSNAAEVSSGGNKPNMDVQAADAVSQGDSYATAQSGRVEALGEFLSNVALSTEIKNEDNDNEAGRVTISTIHAAKGLEWPAVFIPAAYQGSIPHSRAEDHDEELRLLYVAMTRAKAMLYLSYPKKDTQFGATNLSNFLTERNVARQFSNAGSALTTQDVHEMSLVLYRSCPPGKLIQAAQENTRPREDTRYLKITSKGLELEYTDESPYESKKRKRSDNDVDLPGLRVPVVGFKPVTTLMQEARFSSTINRSHEAFQDTEKSGLRSRDSIPADSEAREMPKPLAVPRKHKLKPQQQSSVATYFCKSSSSNSSTIKGDQHGAPLQILSENATTRPFVASNKRLDWTTETHARLNTQRSALPTQADATSTLRPASTFHNLSSAQPSQSFARGPSLGIRRSMNGWASRKHK